MQSPACQGNQILSHLLRHNDVSHSAGSDQVGLTQQTLTQQGMSKPGTTQQAQIAGHGERRGELECPDWDMG